MVDRKPFEIERLAANDALAKAAEALRNQTADSIAGLAQFFPNDPTFAGGLALRIEKAKGNLRDATIEQYDVGKTKNDTIYQPEFDGRTYDVHQYAQFCLKGDTPTPAFAFPPSNIYILSSWFAPETYLLRPGVLVHEAFHLEFNERFTGSSRPIVGHSKRTINDAYAYQGFVCFVAGLEQVAPLEIYNGPYLFGECPAEPGECPAEPQRR